MERLIRRRDFLRLTGGALGLSALLTACGGEDSTPTPADSGSPSPPPAASGGTSDGSAASPITSPTTAGAATPASSASGEPIRIGVLLTLSGPQGVNGEGNLRGLTLALDQAGMQFGGRPVELIIEDSAGQPEQAITKTRQLIERDRVHLIAGITLSNEAAAVRDILVQAEMPTIVTNAGLQALTRDPAMRSPYLFRVSFANGQYDAPAADYAYETLGYRRMVLHAADYAAGHEEMAAFRSRFEQAGGEIVDEVVAPIGTQDFGPYLQRIEQAAADADAVFAFHGTSTDAIRFLVQYQEFGLKDSIPLIPSGADVDQSILPEIGDAALGLVSGTLYTAYNDTPESQEFVEAFTARHEGILPGLVDYAGYIGGRVIAEALTAIDGEVENKEALLEALKAVEFTGPAGNFRFHPESQGPVTTILLCRVEQLDDGTYANIVVDRIPDFDDLSF
nr:MAG: ABC transporter substrate-binding protein [Sphaerobacter thermophilus]